MQWYFLLKSAHLVFVMAWLAAVFYLPRLSINFVESAHQTDVQARLLLMARRLYRFGHVMFGLALLCGIGLLHFADLGPWLHIKLSLVTGLFAYFIWSYKRLMKTQTGGVLPSVRALRLLNEVPVLFVFLIVYLVLAKPV